MKSKTLRESIFKRGESDNESVNKTLLSYHKISDGSKISKLQTLRRYLYDIIDSLDNSDIKLHYYSAILTQLEFQLQRLWGFSENENYHRWFDNPKCICPKYDNMESLGSKFRKVNTSCIIHGTKS